MEPFKQLLDTQDFITTTIEHIHSEHQIESFTLNHHTKVTLIDNGILSFEPLDSHHSPYDLILSSGIHGNETGPIELCNRLVQDLLSEKLITQTRVLFILGNPLAMQAEKRFVEHNLNRLFCGAYQEINNCYEKDRAKKLEHYVKSFYQSGNSPRLHYDLHTAIRPSHFEKFAIYPYLNDQGHYNKEQISFLLDSGIETLLLSHKPTTTFSFHTSKNFNAHGFTLELGKVHPFGQNDPNKLIKLQNNLIALINNGKLAQSQNLNNLNSFTVHHALIKTSDNFELHLGKDIKNFSLLPLGSTVSSDEQDKYKVKYDDERIVFPNPNVPVGDWTGLVLRPCTLEL
ncbi:succinylglutamate desuccinylase [Piscirickettsia litoralis]|uniref:Succinylglutamate desuccinylase n=1 Tax=Piscirickettsia litoralis TaxID=1891921 RepID=A0ABX3A3U4_9GAMM|nr:succinylglutamate desuccinylase [Piscirickettsia litoralis]ODN43128.1 succinylglutamate desuccinylase [Piscirickettsia litoralis]